MKTMKEIQCNVLKLGGGFVRVHHTVISTFVHLSEIVQSKPSLVNIKEESITSPLLGG